MKIVKTIAIVLVAYVAIVVVFESLLGVIQPEAGNTLVITSTDEGGNAGDRVVSRIESGGQLYVAANHWPRAWYERALANPDVQVVVDGAKTDRRAVPVESAEHDRIDAEHALPLLFRVLTGFPPRYFLRLDPR